MELNQLWSQMVKDARSSYRLYSADLDQAAGAALQTPAGLADG
jgi:hypothetical protein